tara:strand:+ start:428 stop:1378 length:951 start_codon:yes stop_codon:yes gene_type:complete
VTISDEVTRAERRISGLLTETPLQHSALFSELTGAEVYLKLENLQPTGSFKIRGALSKVLSLNDADRARGIVTASSGNHGAAVAFALRQSGAQGLVFVPENASVAKVENIRRLGAEVEFHGCDSGQTEVFARQWAAQQGRTFVPPYNDPQVIGGQGTIAVEFTRQLADIDAVFVAIGGGGLISGIAATLAVVSPATRVFGVSPENSQVMIQSIRANQILDLPSLPTLSDGTAGGIEPGSVTFELIRDHVDELLTVSEAEIAHAMRTFMEAEHQLLEGAAGVALAGCLKQGRGLEGRRVVVIVCGANISLDTLKSIL